MEQFILLARDDIGLVSSGEKGTVKRHLGGTRRLVGGLDMGHSMSFTLERASHELGGV